jgi:HD-GYP domain-containing protein (c-di-GMP phosphodiesterase class II)
VANLAVAIGREMGLADAQLQGVYFAGLIHDVGKINVPVEILSKPGRLSEPEFQLVRAHSRTGYEIIKGLDFPWPIADIVLQHHERLDGSGYPNGVTGKDMLVEAKILATADVVEAMMSHRPYRPALGVEIALAEIEKGKSVLYDAASVEACVKLLRSGAFPVDHDAGLAAAAP